MNKKIFLALLALIIFAGLVSATTTTTVVKPNGGESLNRQLSPYDINFTVTGTDKNTFLVDINYSTSNTQGTGTPIINDTNVATLTCSGTDFNQVTASCRYSWNYSQVPNGNYYILVDTNSLTASGFDASNSTFSVYSSYVKTYSGGDLGQIFIDIIGAILAALARNLQAVVILIIMGMIAVFFKEDIGKLMGIFRERLN